MHLDLRFRLCKTLLWIRDGSAGGVGGLAPPQNVPKRPSVPNLLKISVHCRHFHDMLFFL